MARTYYYVRQLNRTSLLNQSRRNRLLKKIFAKIETPTYYVQSPIYVDYGFNTYIGKNFLSNYNLIIQDEGEVKTRGRRQGDVAFVLTKTGDVSMLCLPFEFICFQQLTLTGGLLFARRPFHCLTFSLWRHRRDGPRPRTTPVAQKRREASPIGRGR